MAARRRPTGLTTPRVENAELQRFLDQVSQRVTGLSRELGDRTVGAGGVSGGGGGTGGGTTPSGGFLPNLPVLAVPPKPDGVEVFCGIGICIVSWTNPYRIYANHGNTIVYRGTTDRFDEATQIGQAAYMVFVDETGLEDNTEYFYWVRWVNTTDVQGPLSDVASGTTGLDPEAVYDEIVAWLESSPLNEALQSDILAPEFVLEEIRRISAAISLLSASAADAADAAASDAQDAADDAQTSADAASTAAATAQTEAEAAAAAAAAAQATADAAASTAGGSATSAAAAAAAAAAAQAAAEAAQTTADNAATAAANAATMASAASAAAAEAKTAADAAKSTADAAATAAAAAAAAAAEAKTAADASATTATTAAAQALTALNSANASLVSANKALAESASLLDDIGTLQRADRLIVQINGNARNTRFTGDVVAGGEVDIGTHATDTMDDITVDVYTVDGTDIGSNRDRYNILLEPGMIDWTVDLWIRSSGTDFALAQANLKTAVTDITRDEDWEISTNVARFPLQTQITDLSTSIDGKADASALTALTATVSQNTDGITSHTAQITSLEARLTGTSLGPEQNEFTGADRAAAETARDTYFTANPTKLQSYDADDELNIRLTFGVLRVFQHRVENAWVDNGEVEPTAAAISTLSATVTQQGTDITANTDSITALTTTVGSKADSSDLDTKADTTAVTALSNRVTANEGSIVSNQENIALLEAVFDGVELGPEQNTFSGDDETAAETARDTYFADNADKLAEYDADISLHIRLLYGTTTQYQNRVDDAWTDVDADPRASGTALTTLSSRVTVNETGISANQRDITSLTTTVGTKADTSALTTLTNRVSANETTISAEQTKLSALTTTVGTKADTTALNALTNRVTSTETDIEIDQSDIAQLEASLDGITLGPVTNTFTGADEDAAESARDTYFTENLMKLGEYDADATLHIRLVYGDTTVYQNRASNDWVNVAANPLVATTALTTLSNRVSTNETTISAEQTKLSNLTTTVGTKADATALTALTNRVMTAETELDTAEGNITTIQGQITTLTSSVGGKADTTALTALTNRVTATETDIAVDQSDIALLEAALDGVTLGPTPNTFSGTNKAAAETARDNHFSANADALAMYDADATLHIRLLHGTTTVYQNRQSSDWADVAADPRASGSALTTLTNTVTTQGMDITTAQGDITTLTSSLGDKADESALTDGLATKADATALTALTNRVTTNEGGITINQNEVAQLEASLDGLTLGPAQNTFSGADEDAAESARDTYFAADNSRLTPYNDDVTLHIRLLYGNTTVYQRRNNAGTRWRNSTADPRASTSAVTNLGTRITSNESGVQANTRDITALESRITSRNLGPEQNEFTGADRSEAETARDTYFTNNPTKLQSYNADSTLNIRLVYNSGALRVYQTRVGDGETPETFAWTDNGEVEATAAAVTTLSATVTQQGMDITTNTDNITDLTTSVGGKADASALTTLMNTVSTNTSNITANQNSITELTTTVGAKADSSALTALTNTVATNTGNITTVQGDITTLTSNLNSKANTTALTALTNRVTTTETDIEADQADIALLEAALDGVALGPSPNTFTGTNRAGAESARDDHFMANADALAGYDADASLHIRLRWRTNTRYQNRVENAWSNVDANPLATTSALTTLSNRVSINETSITSVQSDVTTLTTTVGNKADTTALTALSNKVTTAESDIDSAETNITAIQEDITALTTSVGTKADTTALTALTNRVTATETDIKVDQSDIAQLEASLDGLTLGPVTNTFAGDNAAAAANARNTYFAGNSDALAVYDADATIHIRLVYGTTTVYQNRQSGAWTNVDADPRAAVSSLTGLTTSITANTNSITTVQGDITDLTTTLGTKADTTALTALTNRVATNESGIQINQDEVSRLDASLDGVTLGPLENTFSGANQAAAETARDTWFSADTDRLDAYNDDVSLHIRLRYGTTTVYQRRNNAGTRWRNTAADPRASTSAVSNLGTRITSNESGVQANTRDISALEARITSRDLGPETNEFTADTRAEAETARDTYFTANPMKLAQYNADDTLNIRLNWSSGALRVYQNRVGDGETPETFAWTDNGEVEATAAAVTTLSATVTQQGNDITTNADNITSLTTTVSGKADTSALTALQTSITENADGIEANSMSITALRASTEAFVPGMELNEFTGADRAAAETMRDTYEAANMAWLMDYNDNPKNYILLQYD